MSQQTLELTRRAFRAFNERDFDTALATVHDDVEAYPRLASIEGGYFGHEGVRRWWTELLNAFPDFQAEILGVRDLGEFMVLALRLSGSAAQSDTPVDALVWHVNRFRDGKVIWWRVFTDESEALEAAGATRSRGAVRPG